MAGGPKQGWSSLPRKGKGAVKVTPLAIAALAIAAMVLLGGCQARLTLEEAQERCTKQGGLLAVIYTQQITSSGIGQPIKTPGECVSPNKFEAKSPASGNAPPPPK